MILLIVVDASVCGGLKPWVCFSPLSVCIDSASKLHVYSPYIPKKVSAYVTIDDPELITKSVTLTSCR